MAISLLYKIEFVKDHIPYVCKFIMRSNTLVCSLMEQKNNNATDCSVKRRMGWWVNNLEFESLKQIWELWNALRREKNKKTLLGYCQCQGNRFTT